MSSTRPSSWDSDGIRVDMDPECSRKATGDACLAGFTHGPWPPRRVSAQVGFQFGPIVAARDDVTERHDMADRFQISVLYVQVAADGAGMRKRT